MIISKKKFERMVEEEVHKRMNAADEKRWEQERFCNMEREIYNQIERVNEAVRRLEHEVFGDHRCGDCEPKTAVRFY